MDPPHDQRCPLLWELVDVLLGRGVTPIQSPLEEVRQLVEFAELPLRIRRVLPTTDRRRVLVIFLLRRISRFLNETAVKVDTDLEISEERVDEEVDDDEWRKDGVENTHEDESSLEPMRSEASATHPDLEPYARERCPNSPLH